MKSAASIDRVWVTIRFCLLRRNIVTRVVRRAPCPVLVVGVGQRDLFAGCISHRGPRFEAESGVRTAKMNY
jgi:hypothetical protein